MYYEIVLDRSLPVRVSRRQLERSVLLEGLKTPYKRESEAAAVTTA
jgi:hypothetical protein